MLLEEKSMLKGIRGDVNRQVNCEMNNISRKIRMWFSTGRKIY